MLRWEMRSPNEPLAAAAFEPPQLAGDEVLVRVAGCGICHTDIGFWSGAVRTRSKLPLALGHEISGTVEAAGAAARRWLGQAVVVPAVIPCGDCDACRRDRTAICPRQIFPGNDIHGGFATHVVVPSRGLCAIPATLHGSLAELAVLADAITTPLEAVRRAGLHDGDVAIFVGAGGIGGFGVQIARARGAHVVAIDVDPERLELVARHGAALCLDARRYEGAKLRDAVRDHLRAAGKPLSEWKIFETSGTAAGQETAFQLLVHGAHLAVVGFTMDAATVRLSNLMALDARAEGNWGCPPALYPQAVELVESGQVVLAPFVEPRRLQDVNAALADVQAHRIRRRVVLIP